MSTASHHASSHAHVDSSADGLSELVQILGLTPTTTLLKRRARRDLTESRPLLDLTVRHAIERRVERSHGGRVGGEKVMKLRVASERSRGRTETIAVSARRLVRVPAAAAKQRVGIRGWKGRGGQLRLMRQERLMRGVQSRRRIVSRERVRKLDVHRRGVLAGSPVAQVLTILDVLQHDLLSGPLRHLVLISVRVGKARGRGRGRRRRKSVDVDVNVVGWGSDAVTRQPARRLEGRPTSESVATRQEGLQRQMLRRIDGRAISKRLCQLGRRSRQDAGQLGRCKRLLSRRHGEPRLTKRLGTHERRLQR